MPPQDPNDADNLVDPEENVPPEEATAGNATSRIDLESIRRFIRSNEQFREFENIEKELPFRQQKILNQPFFERGSELERTLSIQERSEDFRRIFVEQESPFYITRRTSEVIKSISDLIRSNLGSILPSAFTEEERLRLANLIRAANLAEFIGPVMRIAKNLPGIGRTIDLVGERFDEELLTKSDMSALLKRRRKFAPILAPLLIHPVTETLITKAIDFVAARRTRETIERLNGKYIPVVIIGTGPGGQAFANKLINQYPEDAGCFLFVDDRLRPGGQFADPERRVHGLNNRVRPTSDAPAIPSTIADICSIGEVPIELADIESATYGSNAKLGRVVSTSVLSTTQNMAMGFTCGPGDIQELPQGSKGRYRMTLRSITDSSVSCTVLTDFPIFATGIGEPNLGFIQKQDRETQKIAMEEREKADRGEIPEYLDFPMYARFVGSRRHFPKEFLKGKKPVFIGDGDSARVGILGVLDYEEFDASFSVTNLDWVREAVVVGVQPITDKEVDEIFKAQKKDDSERLTKAQIREKGVTKEVICKRLRSRYLALTGEYPRMQDADFFSRIIPRTERSRRMFRNTQGQLCIEIEGPNGEIDIIENIVVFDFSGTKKNGIALALRNLVPPELVSGENVDLSTFQRAISTVGTEIIIDSDDPLRTVSKISLISIDRPFGNPSRSTITPPTAEVKVRFVDRSDWIGILSRDPDNDEGYLLDYGGDEPAQIDLDNTKCAILIPRTPKKVRIADQTANLGARPFGEAIEGQDVLIIAAAADIPVEEGEFGNTPAGRRLVEALKRVNENLKSLFRQMIFATGGGSVVAERRRRKVLSDADDPVAPQRRPASKERKEVLMISARQQSELLVPLASGAVDTYLASGESESRGLIALALGMEVGDKYMLDKKNTVATMVDITIQFDEDQKSFRVRCPYEETGKLDSTLTTIFSDPLIQTCVLNYTTKRLSPTRTVRIRVPIKNQSLVYYECDIQPVKEKNR